VLVLGIDPGTAITGFGLVKSDAGDLALVGCGVITTPAKESLPARLQTIYRELTRIVAAYRPAEAAVEELFFSKNVRTALAVGHARGVILLALADATLPIYEYTPLQVKQTVTGYGQADKKQMQEMVRLILGLREILQPDDAADAVAVAICHIHSSHLSRLVGEDGGRITAI
jgi:crossover junction endodeoxyribonuclease RuvC